MSQYRRIPTREIIVDERYQRPVEEHRVSKIAEGFDETLFGVLEVSRRNGKCAVFDGQHRLEAARLLKLKDVPCLVHEGLSAEAEAGLFVRLQRERKNLSPNDRFKARLFFQDATAIDIQRVTEEAGFHIRLRGGGAADRWEIRAVTRLERAYTMHGPEHLLTTLKTIAQWWGGDKGATDGVLIGGLAYFLKAYDGTLREDHIEKLKATAPTVILRRATGGMGGYGSASHVYVAQELKKTAGMRGRLPKPKTAA